MSVNTLDRDVLTSLRLIMEEDFAALLNAWWQDAGEKMAQLHEAVRNDDHDAVRRTAHSLKGSGSNLGLLALNAVCHEIESTATSMNLASEATGYMLVNLQQSINASAQALQEETGVILTDANFSG